MSDESTQLAFIDQALRHFALPENARVLETGSGSGFVARHLAKRNPDWMFACIEPYDLWRAALLKSVKAERAGQIAAFPDASQAMQHIRGEADLLIVHHRLATRRILEEIFSIGRIRFICGFFSASSISPFELYSRCRRKAERFHLKAIDGLTELKAGLSNQSDQFERDLTIVVPAHNTEHYLGRCLSSLVRQSIPDKEIIVVDDGSTDRTGRIADAWSKRHPEIRVVHQERRGPGGARAAGQAVAQGEFIGFVDSDDWAEPDMFERLLNAMLLSQAEIAQCGFWVFDERLNRRHLNEESFPTQTTGPDGRAVARGVDLLLLQPSIWRRVYRAEFLEKCPTNVAASLWLHEDLVFQFATLIRASRVAIVSEPLYNYRVGRKGQAVGIRDRRQWVHFPAFQAMAEICSHTDDALAERRLKQIQLNSHLWVLGNLSSELRSAYRTEAAHDIFRGRRNVKAVQVIADSFRRSFELGVQSLGLYVRSRLPLRSAVSEDAPERLGKLPN